MRYVKWTLIALIVLLVGDFFITPCHNMTLCGS